MCGGVEWVNMCQNKTQCCTLVNTLMNIRLSRIVGVPAEVRTEQLPNTSPERQRCIGQMVMPRFGASKPRDCWAYRV
jgi:hypothetical protein